MFNKENWQTGNIVRGIARIPLSQAHFALLVAMVGSVLFLVGFLSAGPSLRSSLKKIPDPLLLMWLGMTDFALFLPLSYIVYLSKELQKTKDRVEELAGRQG